MLQKLHLVALVLAIGLILPGICFAGLEPDFLLVKNRFAEVQAVLYTPPNPSRIAVIQVHPWSNSFGSFAGPVLSKRGFAVLLLNTRAVNKEGGEPDELLEPLLLDVAAGVEEMKSRSYSTVLLAGISAGGPLISLYENVAENGNQAFRGDRKLFPFEGFFGKDQKPLTLPRVDGLVLLNPIDGTATSFLNPLILLLRMSRVSRETGPWTCSIPLTALI